MSTREAVRGRHWLVRSALAVPAALVLGVALVGTALAGTSSSTPAALSTPYHLSAVRINP